MKNVKFNLKSGLGILVFLLAFSFSASAQSAKNADVKSVKQEVTNNKSTSISNATPNSVRNTTKVSMKISSTMTDFERNAINSKRELIVTEKKNGKRIQSGNTN